MPNDSPVAMMPWMNHLQILFIESALLFLARSARFLECLEWGAGGSTVCFSKLLDSQCANYKWTSLEYDRAWFEKVKTATGGNGKVELTYFDIKSANPFSRAVRMDDYVYYPRALNKKFDFILIDGRKRRRCLLEASLLVKDSGMVVLHDANRAHYRCAFSQYAIWSRCRICGWGSDQGMS